MAAGLGELWGWDGGIHQGCLLSMDFIVALYVSWCRRLETVPGIKRQLSADNLKCSAVCPNALFGAARFTARYVRSVGQDVSPGKCGPCKVALDVRDLGGHLDFTRSARAGTLYRRVKEATHRAAAVGALPWV